jgi:hypothetical protein
MMHDRVMTKRDKSSQMLSPKPVLSLSDPVYKAVRALNALHHHGVFHCLSNGREHHPALEQSKQSTPEGLPRPMACLMTAKHLLCSLCDNPVC